MQGYAILQEHCSTEIFQTLEHQPYLDIIAVRKFRVALTKLRVSSHRLEIEAGRWHKPISTPFDMRKCHICNVLEDEFHFVILCPLYNDLRMKYIPNYYRQRYTLIQLFNSDNKNLYQEFSNLYLQSF